MYHYGNQYHKYLGSTTINTGGQLFVNKDGLTVSGGPLTDLRGQSPTAGTFLLTTRDCGATVTINPGGLFELGTPGATTTTGYKAEVRFESGSVLDVAGGTLLVNTHSTLRMRAGSLLVLNGAATVRGWGNIIVEPGARVEIRPNAAIALQDADSRLTLRGGFAIKANSTFQPTGNGYVLFDLPDWTNLHGGSNNNLEIEDGTARFVLRGSSPDDVAAKVAANSHVVPSFWGDFEFTIDNCTVEMGKATRLNTANANVTFTNAQFLGNFGADGANVYDEVRIHGCGRELIRDCRFSGAEFGLKANLNACAGAALWLENVAFDQYKQAGLHTVGKAAYLLNCTFNGVRYEDRDNLPVTSTNGWLMTGADLPGSVLKNTTFTDHREAVRFAGLPGIDLTLRGPQIHHNERGVVFAANEGRLRAECGAIHDNTDYGLTVEHGTLEMSAGAKFNILNNGQGQYTGGSHPVWNVYNSSIYLLDATGLELAGGGNDIVGFDPTQSGIRGNLRLPALTLNGAGHHLLDATGNRWNIQGTAPTMRTLDVQLRAADNAGNQGPVQLTDPTPVGYNTCGVNPCVIPLPNGQHLDCWLNEKVVHCTTCEPVSASFAAPDSLHRLVRQAIASQQKYDPLAGNDGVAMQRLAELLLLPLTDTTADEQRILAEAYRELLKLYAGLGSDSLRAVWRQHSLLQSIIDGKLADTPTDTLLTNPKFYLLMDKALAAYTANELDAALAGLAEAAPLNTPLTQAWFDYWECFLRTTQQFRDSTLTEDDYLAQLVACHEPRAAGRGVTRQSPDDYLAEQIARYEARRAATAARLTEQATLRVAPNPATTTVTVSLAEAPAGPVTLHLRDMAGRAVRRWERTAAAASSAAAWTLDLSGIAPGVYVLHVGTGARTYTRRLVVGGK